MTKIDATRATVTPTTVTHLPDLALRELWLGYADALSPFDFCSPDNYPVDEPWRPLINDEHAEVHFALRKIRRFVAETRDHSDFSRAVAAWLRSVDATHRWHGIRQAFIFRIANATHLPLPLLAAEPLMRARVDDAMVRLAGFDYQGYQDCYRHVLSELQAMLTPTAYDGLRSHVLTLIT